MLVTWEVSHIGLYYYWYYIHLIVVRLLNVCIKQGNEPVSSINPHLIQIAANQTH